MLLGRTYAPSYGRRGQPGLSLAKERRVACQADRSVAA
jgi:hypothetical protein